MNLNCLGFRMLTVETAVFDCICSVVPVMSDTSQGLKLKSMSGRKFATSYKNLVATLQMINALK